MKPTAYYDTTASDTIQEKKIDELGKVDSSDLMMIIRWVMNICFRSSKLEWASLSNTTLHISMKIREVLEIISYILGTLSVEYIQLFR